MPAMCIHEGAKPHAYHSEACDRHAAGGRGEPSYDGPFLCSTSQDGPLRPPWPCMGMIFGTRAQPRVMSSKFSDDFRKMDPCKTAACMGAWVHFRKMDPCRTEACMGPPHSEILCGAALPGTFFSRKNRSLVLLQPKTVFFASH